jgi:polar amino acid transport system substrate-binding protein
MRFSKSCVYPLACFLLLAQNVSAGCSRPVDVAFSSISPDMTLGAEGQYEGVAIEFLQVIAQRTGCVFNYVEMPRARAWYLFGRQGTDIVPAAIANAERDQSGTFFDHLVFEPVSLLSLKSHPVTLSHSQEILNSSVRLAMVRGHNYGPRFASLTANPALVERLAPMKDPQTLARMLQARRMDAVIVMASIFAEAAVEQGIAEQIHAQTIEDLDWSGEGMYLTSSRLPAEDIKTLTLAISQLNAEGFYGQRMQAALKSLPEWATHGFRFQPPDSN